MLAHSKLGSDTFGMSIKQLRNPAIPRQNRRVIWLLIVVWSEHVDEHGDDYRNKICQDEGNGIESLSIRFTALSSTKCQRFWVHGVCGILV
jgi:hypothetical protein